jgi:2-keto-4-pentenoate hydratase/2-oxohepta-3-ene-1,7-dioic acid hydratase in catechol pathway
MRIINTGGRLGLLVDGGYVDVETASAGAFDSDPQAVYDRWESFCDWARGALAESRTEGILPFVEVELRAPVPRPRQVFAIGVNYRDHAEEAGIELPLEPVVFTKFPSAITGPYDTIELPSGSVDFEAELVVVIGRVAYRVPESEAWSYVAGLTIGQDLRTGYPTASTRAAAVQPRQVLPRLRTAGAVPGHPGRVRQPR